MKAKTFKLNKTDEKNETIFEGTVNLKAKFFWDSHGSLVPWKNSKGNNSLTRSNSFVKIVKKTYKLNGIDFEHWKIFANEEKIEGDVYRYKYNPKTKNLNVKIVNGWG